MDRKELEADIIKFYKKYKSRGKAFTARHFAKYGESESRVLYYIKKFERNPPTKATTSSTNVLVDTTNSNLPQTSTGRVVKKTPAKKSTMIAPPTLTFLTENFANKGKQNLNLLF